MPLLFCLLSLLFVAEVHSADCGQMPLSLKNLSYAVYPGSPDYDEARHNVNKRFNVFPQAIFYPETAEQAQYVFHQLKKNCLPFSVRAGRHCFEPGSLSPCYIFDVSAFNSIVPDVASETVYVGAGCRLRDVIDTLGALNYAIPTGTCPSVGAVGLTLGGGIGLLGRPYGLTCDSLKSVTLLNAKGEIVEVDETHYSDLFWALRGGGNGSYGIVLGMTYKMHYIPEATFYELTWEWDPALIIPIMEAWQKWIQTLPSSITSVLGIRHPQGLCALPHTTPPLVIRIFGLKVGSEPFNEWEAPFAALNPTVFTYQGRYIDTTPYWVSESNLPYSKNKSTILMKPLKKKTMKQVVRFFEELEAKNPCYLVYFNFEAFGGVIPDYKTAFFPRKAMGWWYQAYYWDNCGDTDEILAMSQAFYKKSAEKVSKYCYANIVDYTIGKDYMHRYYGNHSRRLIKIKQKYDPCNLFRWKQSIPTNYKST